MYLWHFLDKNIWRFPLLVFLKLYIKGFLKIQFSPLKLYLVFHPVCKTNYTYQENFLVLLCEHSAVMAVSPNDARKQIMKRSVFRSFSLSLLYEVFKANQTKPKLVISSFMPLLWSTTMQACNRAQTYSLPTPQSLNSRLLNSHVRLKDKTCF